jgi:hypothetical protein
MNKINSNNELFINCNYNGLLKGNYIALYEPITKRNYFFTIRINDGIGLEDEIKLTQTNLHFDYDITIPNDGLIINISFSESFEKNIVCNISLNKVTGEPNVKYQWINLPWHKNIKKYKYVQ